MTTISRLFANIKASKYQISKMFHISHKNHKHSPTVFVFTRLLVTCCSFSFQNLTNPDQSSFPIFITLDFIVSLFGGLCFILLNFLFSCSFLFFLLLVFSLYPWIKHCSTWFKMVCSVLNIYI